MIVFDTTVLVYAVGSEHPLREPCRRVFAAQRAGRIDGATTVEVIQEFTYIRARTWPRQEATVVARDYISSLQLLQTTPEDLRQGLTLFERHPALGMFDAMLAAVALNRGADGLVSTDHGFGSVSGLRWIDPATPDLDALLGPVEGETIDFLVEMDRPSRTGE